ncbi:MAG: MAPEG family protein [Beijerinckiaceae bacterium]|nr:MAPEG family protein [Beijerinckiaceae bacterium]
MIPDLWILLSLALLTEILTLPPVVARGSVPGGIKWIFYNRDTVLEGVAPWGGRAVRAHSNLADNLAIYAAVIGIASVTGATNGVTFIAGIVLLIARVLHALVYIAGIPYLRTAVFAVAQVSMLVYVWQIVVHYLAR